MLGCDQRKMGEFKTSVVNLLSINKLKEVANLEFINLCTKIQMENFLLFWGGGEICITDYYECFKRKRKIPVSLKKQLIIHFKLR